jgi:hypothetical protein
MHQSNIPSVAAMAKLHKRSVAKPKPSDTDVKRSAVDNARRGMFSALHGKKKNC